MLDVKVFVKIYVFIINLGSKIVKIWKIMKYNS